jgi:hypothetical protein
MWALREVGVVSSFLKRNISLAYCHPCFYYIVLSAYILAYRYIPFLFNEFSSCLSQVSFKSTPQPNVKESPNAMIRIVSLGFLWYILYLENCQKFIEILKYLSFTAQPSLNIV